MNASLHPPRTMPESKVTTLHCAAFALMHNGHVPVACGGGQGAACTETCNASTKDTHQKVESLSCISSRPHLLPSHHTPSSFLSWFSHHDRSRRWRKVQTLLRLANAGYRRSRCEVTPPDMHPGHCKVLMWHEKIHTVVNISRTRKLGEFRFEIRRF